MPASSTIAATATGVVSVVGQARERERVVREGDRHRRDGARGDHEQQRPAVEERRQRSPGLPQVDVAAAGARPPVAQLAVAERADQRDHPAHHPRGQRQAG